MLNITLELKQKIKKTLNEENAQELIDELKKDYEYIDSAFLYKKVMTTKEENDD